MLLVYSKLEFSFMIVDCVTELKDADVLLNLHTGHDSSSINHPKPPRRYRKVGVDK